MFVHHSKFRFQGNGRYVRLKDLNVLNINDLHVFRTSPKTVIAVLGEISYNGDSSRKMLFLPWGKIMGKFVGRERELGLLKGLLHKKSASLVVIRGRRRIGKSRLAEEFASSFSKTYILSGIPPEPGVTAISQRAEFLRQLQEYKLPIYHSDDWGNLFDDLAKECQKGRILIVLDEITWMGSLDPTFLPKLKTAWDRHFKKNPHLVMVLSGSNSAWISKNILSSTGFFGRVSTRLLLGELSLSECSAFWDGVAGKISPYEKFKILSVTGGIPRYLEEIRHDLSAEANLQRLCFDAEGLLFQEFDQIFHDLFQKKGPFYKEIIETMMTSPLTAAEIADKLSRSRGGDLSKALQELKEAGFIARDYSWSFASAKRLETSRYRIRDNYLRFYLKYILPHKEQVESGALQTLPTGWLSLLGLQFENLVINNGPALWKQLGIAPEDVVMAGTYLQTARARRQGCQIDYLIQTKFGNLFVCEVKFKQGLVGTEVIEEVQEKLDRLELPRGFSCRPVFVHINGVTEELADRGFFAKIIDFSELLR
jgi:uncharacterized protein